MRAHLMTSMGLLCLFLVGCQSGSTPAKPAAAPASVQAAPPASTLPAKRTDNWWLARHQSIVANVQRGGHEIAFLGDSITQQWETAGKDVWARDWAPRKAVNCGIGGDRTQHVIGRLDDGLLDALAADNNAIRTVIIHIGTNNTAEPADRAPEIVAGISAVVSRVQDRLPRAKIILMSVFPRGAKPNPHRFLLEDANARLAPLADGSQLRILDIGPKFVSDKGEIPAALMPDFLHLSADGYEIWSRALIQELGR